MSPAAPSPASRYLAAAVQFEPTMFAKEANVARLLDLCEEAAERGAKLIVTPELGTTGYCWHDRAEVAPEVEPVPGPTTDRFAAFCARRGCWVVVSLPEVAPATGVYYNSAVLVGPHGVAGVYRKTHAFVSEPRWAKDGDLGLPVFDTPLGRVAMAICMDATYPETTRVPAVRGADLIAFPTNWLGEKAPSPTWMARAAESGVWFVAANRWGVERGVQFDGGSCVVAPDGAVVASRDTGDGVVLAEIDLARARDKRPDPRRGEDLLADRRPDAYGDLTLNRYLWDPAEMHGLYGRRALPAGGAFRFAALQFAPEPGNADGNLARIAAALAEQPSPDLLVAPELALTGPVADRAAAERLAEPVPGPATDRLRALAAAHGAHLVVGLVERDGDRLFNSAVLVGPEGVAGVYRKVHLAAADRTWATAGDAFPTFDTPVGRVGMLIGYDALFPEAGRVLALDGADVVACPSLVDGPAVRPGGSTEIPLPPGHDAGPTEDHFHLWRERARENCTHLVFANGSAPAMGWSGVFGATPEETPEQQALVRGDRPGLACARLDVGDADPAAREPNPCRAKAYLRMRMPIWYDALQARPDRLPPAQPPVP